MIMVIMWPYSLACLSGSSTGMYTFSANNGAEGHPAVSFVRKAKSESEVFV